jgi:hypothetical protein
MNATVAIWPPDPVRHEVTAVGFDDEQGATFTGAEDGCIAR